MSAVTEVTITESVTDLTAENTNAVTVDITAEATTISVNNFAIPINFMDADNVVFTPHNTITANNVSCLLYTSPSPRDVEESRMPSSA